MEQRVWDELLVGVAVRAERIKVIEPRSAIFHSFRNAENRSCKFMPAWPLLKRSQQRLERRAEEEVEGARTSKAHLSLLEYLIHIAELGTSEVLPHELVGSGGAVSAIGAGEGSERAELCAVDKTLADEAHELHGQSRTRRDRVHSQRRMIEAEGTRCNGN